MFKIFTFVLVVAIALLPSAVQGTNSTLGLDRGGCPIISLIGNCCVNCCNNNILAGQSISCNQADIAKACGDCELKDCVINVVGAKAIVQCCSQGVDCSKQVCNFGSSGVKGGSKNCCDNVNGNC